MIDFLLDVFKKNAENRAIVWRGEAYSYDWLYNEVMRCSEELKSKNVPNGSSVALFSDFSPYSVAWMLTLIQHRMIYVPVSHAAKPKMEEFLEIAQVEWLVQLTKNKDAEFSHLANKVDHPIYLDLQKEGRPGLVLFSSGSTGKSKAAVHDFVDLLEKFKVQKQKKNILAFLLFDHIGGLNTMLYTLSNGGCLVTIEDRSPEAVADAIDKYDVQILPTSPTFCNLLLLRGIGDRYKLPSLELITYGTEVMPESTLKRMNEVFPKVKFQQTYGLSEIGIMRSKSESNDSLWVKIGGEGFETRIVDGLLEVKAKSAMRGYLNAPSPFTEDGWFKTGDAVETKGEYFKILGRRSELIFVGGEKVYPAEVESELLKLSDVEDCVVTGEKHPLTGNIVVARVKLSSSESLPEFRGRMNKELSSRLERFKIPQKVVLANEELFGARFKRSRSVGV